MPSTRRPTVYLCGPITGRLEDVSVSWRVRAASSLAPRISVFDPTKHAPDFTRRSQAVVKAPDDAQRAEHGRAVVERDRQAIKNADVILANLKGASTVSIGSVGEMFWADLLGKPIIVVRECHGNPHDHDMLNEIASSIVEEIDTALEEIKTMFGQ